MLNCNQKGSSFYRAGKPLSSYFAIALIASLILVGAAKPIDSIAQSRDQASNFIDDMGYAILKAAWPTADYSRISFKGINYRTYGADITARVYGVGMLSGSTLWADLVVSIGNDFSILDFEWGDYYAGLPPGTMWEAMGAMIDSLEESNSYSGSSSRSSSGYRFHITNNCRHSVRLAMNYKKVDGNWRAVGWWNVNGNSSRYLTFSDGSYAKTNNSVFYFYAEAQDKTFSWNTGSIDFQWMVERFQ